MSGMAINERLEQLYYDRRNSGEPLPQAEKRPYQNELYQYAIKQNTIVFLGTGLGKTFVSVMVLTDPEFTSKIIHDGKRVAFLVPTQDLAKQQAEYLQRQTQYLCKVYCGRNVKNGLHIDLWDKQIWMEEFQRVHVAVMTAQVFSNLVCTNLIPWETFAVVVFDEGHHVAPSKKGKESGHAYAQIMRHYESYYTANVSLEKPRLLVLTASLINNMPKNRHMIKDHILYLEKIYHSTCVTNLDVQRSMPRFLLFTYDKRKLTITNDTLTSLFRQIKDLLNSVLQIKKANQARMKIGALDTAEKTLLKFQERFRLSAAGYHIKPSQFPDIFEGMAKVRQNLGVWTLKAVIDQFIEATTKVTGLTIKRQEIQRCYMYFIQLLKIIRDAIDRGLGILQPVPDLPTLLLGTATTNMLALLDLLQREYQRSRARGEQFSCIIFIRSRLEVVGLASWLKQVSLCDEAFKFINSDYALGIAGENNSKYRSITRRSPQEQSKMLDDFRNSSRNVILTTAVLEEGIDLPVCSTVIRYNQANNLREFIQSRGRARKNNSSYVSLSALDDESEKTMSLLNSFNDMEISILEFFSTRKEGQVENSVIAHEAIKEEYYDPNPRVRITASMAKMILQMYFAHTSKGAPYVPKPQVVRRRQNDGKILSTLYLPSGCPIRAGVKGNPKDSVQDADSSAAVQALKELHKYGELGEDCLPFRTSAKNIDTELSKLKIFSEEPLDPNLEGRPEKPNDESSRIIFRPLFHQLPMALRENTMQRTYNLYCVKFVALQVRDQCAEHFKQQVVGMITDISLDHIREVMPPKLYNRYGEFQVEIVEIRRRLALSPREHANYLTFMHKYLRFTLGIKNLYQDQLEQHCPLYIVPLKSDLQIDEWLMHDSYRSQPSSLAIEPKSIVGFSKIMPTKDAQGRFTGKDRFIVDEILTDLTPNSHHIDFKDGNMTFAEYARKQYNIENLSTRQPIIKVRKLSRQNANFTKGKRVDESYESRPMHFIRDCLEFCFADANFHLQSSNMLPIIYRVFQIEAIGALVDSILSNTAEFRPEVNNNRFASSAECHPSNSCQSEVSNGDTTRPSIGADGDAPASDAEMHEIPSNENGCELGVIDSDVPMEVLECGDEDGDLDEECGEEYDEDEENSRSDSDSISSSDSESGDDQNLRLQNLDDDSNDRDFLPWNPADYKVADLRKITYETQYHSSTMFHPYLDKYSDFDRTIKELPSQLTETLQNLVNEIRHLESKLTTDQPLKDEDQQCNLSKQVDTSIVPPMKFDTFEPEPNQSRIEPILKALTLRKAHDLFDLERYENVGDSFLKYITSMVLFQRVQGGEGALTLMRSGLVSNKRLTKMAKSRSLGMVAMTHDCDLDYLGYLFGARVDSSKIDRYQNRLKNKDLADIFEAIVGAHLIHNGEYDAILALHWLGMKLFQVEELKIMRNQRKFVFSQPKTGLLPSITAENAESNLRRLTSVVVEFEKTIGYGFKDKSYLIQAFTHPTCITNKVTRSYQRLEFMGDAVLDYLVTRHIYQYGGDLKPGQMTDIRSALVNNFSFAKLALRYRYDVHILHDQQSLFDELNRIRLIMDDLEESQSEIGYEDMLEFDEIIKLLADIFESVAGAIFMDSGCSLDTVWSIYYPMMKCTIERELMSPTINPVRKLYETFTGSGVVEFDVVPDTKIGQVKILCKVDGVEGQFYGVGRNKKEAKLRAALRALKDKPSDEQIAELNRQREEADLKKRAQLAQRPQSGQRPRGRGRGGRGGRGGRARGGQSRGDQSRGGYKRARDLGQR